ncbi:bifunctional tRNA (5-methylaminomethyl-2-thiouridine)(34)-methyltransferase MnmD/FAD-dependent 5-carboxymethylaminomethyl-2-thiouridine(34) oxidoreductase MnmC [Thalassotalea ganghwensis]
MINKPTISFQEDGSPFSETFNDIYFDTESGFLQSKQVFIEGNNIEDKFKSCQGVFTIGETGFGTGLNFLLTLNRFITLLKTFPNISLHYISVEKYPLNQVQLTKALSAMPALAEEAKLLLNCYPDEFNQSFTTEILQGRVKLTLLFDDATAGLSALRCGKNGLVDAWYLDGFSPAKNPDMWHEKLYQQLARLSKPQATISTFTVAGHVRRGLQAVGFRLVKKAYKGKKKEILTGVYQQGTTTGKGYQIRPLIKKPQHVTVIGGGIASACAAYALTEQGIKVTVLCKDEQIAQGASSNKIGALYPLIHQQQDEISLFYQKAFRHAKSFYQQLLKQGYPFAHQWCGLLEIAYKESLVKRQQRFEDLNAWPRDLIHGVNAQQASKLANLSLPFGGLFMPQAGWIAPADLVEQIFNAALATKRLKIKTNFHVNSVNQLNDKEWQINTTKGELHTNVLIIAAGADSIAINACEALPLSSVRGQVTAVNASSQSQHLSTVICHKGYLTPAHQGEHCLGATFDKNSFDTTINPKDDQFNLDMLAKCMPEVVSFSKEEISDSKARLRCMTPDHLPMVGPVPNISKHISTYGHLAKDKNWRYQTPAPVIDNLYVLTGLGARGLCTAPLLADILAADLCGHPYPVDTEQLFNMAPNRFIIRDIIKRKNVTE